MSSIQKNSIPILLKNTNGLILAETGSGKTLTYLIPIINSLLKAKNKQDNKIPRGAIILTPTKELCAQVYQVARLIDPTNQLRISRTGSLAHIAPIVQYMTPEKDKSAEYSPDELRSMTYQNIIQNVNWNIQDIVLSTPAQLDQILDYQFKSDPYSINPQTIVVDEVDLLLGDQNISKGTRNIISKFQKNGNRQFILAGASLPKKINKIPSIEVINTIFKNKIQLIQSDQFHKLSHKIDHEIIDLKKQLEENPSLTSADILKDVIQQNQNFKKIMVFCQSQESTQLITDYLNKLNIKAVPFYASMNTDQRINVLSLFQRGDVQVLVSTDLGSRGLDFYDLDCIIQFDFAQDALQLLHRFGRTARMGKKGKIISFKREKDELLSSKVNQLIETNQTFDQIFSHKRSLRKQSQKQSKYYNSTSDSDFEE